MRNKRIMRVFIALVTVLAIAPVSATAAYAFSDENAQSGVDLSEILIPVVTPEPTSIPEPAPEVTPVPEPRPLTPPGNLTLVDDISGIQAADKQFITVITKSGAYFYIVIDRAGNRENVHFLNLVDEADLMAIMEKDKKTTVTPVPVPSTPEHTPAPTPAPEPKKNNIGSILIVLLLVGALSGGAYYYFKILKPKQAAKGTTASELDDFDFDGDEDDLDFEGTGGEQEIEEYEIDGDMPDFMLTDEPAADTDDESEGKE